MNTIEIAKKLVELCKQGRNMEALDILFADDVVSVEAVEMPRVRTTEQVARTQINSRTPNRSSASWRRTRACEGSL